MIKQGFTLIELLIVFAVLGMIFVIGARTGIDFYRNYSLIDERDKLVALLRKARALAQINGSSTSYGLKITPTEYVLFKGDSYDARLEEVENAERRTVLNIVGPDEIVFGSLSATSSVSGTIVVMEPILVKSLEIKLNYEGMVDY